MNARMENQMENKKETDMETVYRFPLDFYITMAS